MKHAARDQDALVGSLIDAAPIGIYVLDACMRVLHATAVARPAFDETDRNKLIKQVTTGVPPRLDRLRPAAPRDLVTVIHFSEIRDHR